MAASNVTSSASQVILSIELTLPMVIALVAVALAVIACVCGLCWWIQRHRPAHRKERGHRKLKEEREQPSPQIVGTSAGAIISPDMFAIANDSEDENDSLHDVDFGVEMYPPIEATTSFCPLGGQNGFANNFADSPGTGASPALGASPV
jgi:hypothetical protein